MLKSQILKSLLVLAILSQVIFTSAYAQSSSKAGLHHEIVVAEEEDNYIDTFTADKLATITPQESLEILMEGNKRYLANSKKNRDLAHQRTKTKYNQFPHAIVLSCMDSRVPLESIFGQGIGDMFSLRVAGNVVSDEIIGSMEYACNLVGTKLILVVGHSRCGAVTGACDHVSFDKLDTVLERISPSIDEVRKKNHKGELSKADFIEEVSKENVRNVVKQIPQISEELRELIEKGQLAIVGAYYDVATGEVILLDKIED
ncbi:carbonic anhydrase [Myroides injenensis]|uniref:carbonic anhydrase n=1 Tax=Myroides injenensis TaxID=1183151 RepID=UPI00028850E5|nr:carbonic anhydrase [Myroides injenensis]